MLTYELICNNLDVLKNTLPSSYILNVMLHKQEGYLALLIVEYIIDQGEFTPVTEFGNIYIGENGVCSSDESKTVIHSIGLSKVREIQKYICDILLKI